MKAFLQATGRHFPQEIIQCLDSSSEDYVPEFLISEGLLIFSAGLKQAHQVCEASLSPPPPSNLALLRVHLSDFVRLLSQIMSKLDPFNAVLSYKHFLGLLPTSILVLQPVPLLPPTCSTKPCLSCQNCFFKFRTANSSVPPSSAAHLHTMPPCQQCWAAHTPYTHLPPHSLILPLSPSALRCCPRCNTALTMCPVLSCIYSPLLQSPFRAVPASPGPHTHLS